METIWRQRSKPTTTCQDGLLHNEDIAEDDTIKDHEILINNLQKVQFKYVAEGRANVVFSIWESAASKGQFEGTLLRVPKATPGVTPCSYNALHEFHITQVQSQVGHQYLVPQVLIQISAEVADTLHSLRPAHDDSVIQPGYAMLIQDMSASPGYLVLEFKPKWLAQSPIAPPGAKRCRTCAREAFRNSQKQARGQQVVSAPICPLGLVHDDPDVVMASIRRLAPEWPEGNQQRLADALEESGILKKLRDLQIRGDPGRALLDDPSDLDFGLAMTLRDCSCYVRMPVLSNQEEVEIKLADVDKKNWKEKQTYWQDSHRILVEGGWYTCEEEVDRPVVTECILS
ncbi:inositol-pentakisphosphate 2-kinase-domain-containing protein [Xylaria nigripes]|nr:inositol-pentakisphosphate 2-kinase-domain-containing protein [Xylaria nigripes]